MEKSYFFVSFHWADGIFCSNIAHADCIGKVEKEYSKYDWYKIRNIQCGELEMARRKGMPIIEL